MARNIADEDRWMSSSTRYLDRIRAAKPRLSLRLSAPACCWTTSADDERHVRYPQADATAGRSTADNYAAEQMSPCEKLPAN